MEFIWGLLMADMKFDVDYTSLKRANDELVRTGKVSKTSADAFSKAFGQVAKWQQQFTAQQAKVNASLETQHQKQNLANKSAKESANVFRQQAVEIERLANKYKPLYASSKLYERTVEEINQAQRLGVITAQQLESQMERLNAEFQTGTGRFSTYANAMGKGANRAGVAMQQAGYQIGDFIVQVQSGTNPMVAFGQQATQLVGIMYLLPQATLAARVGIGALQVSIAGLALGLGIFIPLVTALGAAWMRSRSAMDKADDGAKNVESALSSARSEIKSMAEELRFLQSGFENTFQLGFADEISAAREELRLAKEDLDTFTLKEGLFQSYFNTLPIVGPLLDMMGLSKSLAEGQDTKAYELAQKRLELAEQELVAAEAIFRLNGQRAGQDAKKISAAESLLQNLKEQLHQQEQTFFLTGEDLRQAENRLELEKLRKEMLEAGIQPLSDQWNEAIRLLQVIHGNVDAAESLARIMTYMANLQPRKTYGGRGSGAEYYGTPDYTNALGYKTIDDLIAEFTKTGGGDKETAEERLSALLKTAESERDLVGVEEERATQLRRAFTLTEQISQMEGGLTEERMKSIQTIVDLEAKTRLLQEAEEKREAQIDEIVGHIRSAFDSLIDGTETVEEAFRKMMYNIAKSIWEQQVMDPLANAATKWITNTFFSAKGSAWNNGVQMFANGGVVNSATPFRHAGGMGIMGEAGAEAIMPLKRGPDGKLGVAGGGGVVIHQNFNFSANGDESVKRIIAQEAPKIASMTQGQIMDARRRGGAMRNTFG
jgi:hypothetical protein